ncbi:L-ascorbate oxidase homolog [Asparagus officinalis]|uniref:L-ascorbate oxidase homolog n=1 Tax=Asparagus officinalis TaxID=4686 RepID=UPI00098E588C|nr:L-ascorbate oxidase homolog [Asparagus officinalis]
MRLVVVSVVLLSLLGLSLAEDPYLFFDWNVTYGTISPLGGPERGILINGQFPGPEINCTSNNNIVVNIFNFLDEPLLFTWNGIQQRKNSWMDGMPGTNCPILPGTNYTFHFQVKDQIGSYFPISPSYRGVARIPPPQEAIPTRAATGWAWSFNQWRSFRWNLTASAARPNPQGSYHYGSINITRTIVLDSSTGMVDGKRKYALNGVSHVDAEVPLKLAEYYNASERVFQYDLIGDLPPQKESRVIKVAPNVVRIEFRTFVEIILQNSERSLQSYHLDGYSFFPVGMGPGKWKPESRQGYNLLDAVSRHTIQVYPKSWTAIMLTFDNAGMWNLRSNILERSVQGQQLYISVVSPERSLRDEYSMRNETLLCGFIKDLPIPPPYT